VGWVVSNTILGLRFILLVGIGRYAKVVEGRDGGGRIRTAHPTPTKDLIISLLQHNWHLLPDYVKTVILILLESTTSTTTQHPQQHTLKPWIAHDDNSPIQRHLCQHHPLTTLDSSNLGTSSSPRRCWVSCDDSPNRFSRRADYECKGI